MRPLGGKPHPGFGASWGYGSWQLKRAGFDDTGYEISPSRSRFASEKLSVRMLSNPARLDNPVDCLLAVHVIEHLPDPNILWKAALSSVKSGGHFVLFTPNGDPPLGERTGRRYHKLWGQVHPLLITPKYLRSAASQYGFRGNLYTPPYPLDDIRQSGNSSPLTGEELCLIAQRP